MLEFASIITDDIDKHNMQGIHLKMKSASIQCLEKINQAIIEKKLSVPFLPSYSHLLALLKSIRFLRKQSFTVFLCLDDSLINRIKEIKQ